jgi:hypothetical protein
MIKRYLCRRHEGLINALGFLSFFFASLILLAIGFGMIGSMFMSTKRLFQVKRLEKDEDNSRGRPAGKGGETPFPI